MPQLDLIILFENVNITTISLIIWVLPTIWVCIRRIVEVLYFKVLVIYIIGNLRQIFHY